MIILFHTYCKPTIHAKRYTIVIISEVFVLPPTAEKAINPEKSSVHYCVYATRGGKLHGGVQM